MGLERGLFQRALAVGVDSDAQNSIVAGPRMAPPLTLTKSDSWRKSRYRSSLAILLSAVFIACAQANARLFRQLAGEQAFASVAERAREGGHTDGRRKTSLAQIIKK
jgi:hypothetical protein